jgi:mannosyltransferase OCH1-like enzyme
VDKNENSLYLKKLKMIPKTLHQVWLGKKPIPKIFLKFKKKWRDLHPDWDYFFWNEEKLKSTECWNLMKKCDTYSAQSNVARIYAILNFGGVYADFDIEWKKNINNLLIHQAFAAMQKMSNYCGAFFGSESQTSWIKYQFDQLKYYVNLPTPWGPKLITKASNLFPENLFTVETKLVYPYLWNEKQDKKKYESNDNYVIHHWSMSWAEEKKPKIFL